MVCQKCDSNINLPKQALIKEAIKGHSKIKASCKECGKEHIVKLILNVDYYVEGDEMEILPDDYVVEVTKEVVNKPVRGLRKLFRRNKK